MIEAANKSLIANGSWEYLTCPGIRGEEQYKGLWEELWDDSCENQENRIFWHIQKWYLRDIFMTVIVEIGKLK